MSPPRALPKVVVLGGGIAGLAAAYELSRGGWQDRYRSIVVYQQGWRLGGKAASGRNLEHQNRIEEHGLHIWFGYYENAFRMLAGCHEELDAMAAAASEAERRRWSPAMTSVERGFHQCDTIGLADDEPDGTWTEWLATFPENDTTPWDRDCAKEPTTWDLGWYLDSVGERTVALARTAIRSLVQEVDTPRLVIEPEPKCEDRAAARLEDAIHLVDDILGRLGPLSGRLVDATVAAAGGLRLLADRNPDDPLVQIGLAQIDAADELLNYIRVRYDDTIRKNATLRRVMTVLDLFLGVTRGLLAHRIVTEDDLDALDTWEWDEWLAAQGVRIESRESTLVRGLSYSLPFAFVDGKRDYPSFSAGVGLRLFLRSFFTYRGALMWKPNAGMGDVVFAPLFELLVKRGVDVQFFHQVTDLDVDHDARRVTTVHLRRQREDSTPPSTERERLRWYRERFLVPVEPREGAGMAEGRLMCWPNRPLPCWGENAGDEELLEVKSDAGEPVELPISPDDVVVLALPLGVLQQVGKQLLPDGRWRDQLRRLGLVSTKSAQLWLRDGCSTSLGWPDDIVASGFSEPFDTFADMPRACASEGPGMGAASVVYLCGVLSDRDDRSDRKHETPRDRVRRHLLTFLTTRAGYLWPRAVDPSTGVFDPATLADPVDLNRQIAAASDSPYTAMEKMLSDVAAQANPAAPYFRANVEPSDRYVLSLPGTAKYRIAPGDSGFGNLFPAGDWTSCVLDAGCMEAATISGMLAAEAITGEMRTIIGRGPEADITVGMDLYWSTT